MHIRETLPTEHLLTPANLLTLSRPLLGAEIAHRLIHDDCDKNVTPLMLVMAATDGEGYVARLVDKYFPGSGRGSTKLGEAADPIADTAAFLEVAVAALKAPHVSKLGKVAVGIVLTGESVKTGWAIWSNFKHRRATGEQLVIKPSRSGKIATAEKFAALTAAIGTHDLEPGRKRTWLGVVAVGAAIDGTVRGEKARQSYQRNLAANK
ncbi:MAG: CDP-alcohol phosphatidyltransferase family protein [Candidatus Saccharimonadales bacterium]